MRSHVGKAVGVWYNWADKKPLAGTRGSVLPGDMATRSGDSILARGGRLVKAAFWLGTVPCNDMLGA
jgi:hypothetical protein